MSLLSRARLYVITPFVRYRGVEPSLFTYSDTRSNKHQFAVLQKWTKCLSTGYVVDETPDAEDVDVDFASYKSAVSVKGNVLHYEREYVVRQVEIPPAKAADFRRLENAILADEKGAAVLKKQ